MTMILDEDATEKTAADIVSYCLKSIIDYTILKREFSDDEVKAAHYGGAIAAYVEIVQYINSDYKRR